jgi:hypothetical protein
VPATPEDVLAVPREVAGRPLGEPDQGVRVRNFALYVDEDGVVRRVRDRSEHGRLRRRAEHVIDDRHFAYHREQCVIGPSPA